MEEKEISQASNGNNNILSFELGQKRIEQITINDHTAELVYDTNYITPMANKMLSSINRFEKRSWSSDNKGVVTAFPMFDKAFQNGLPSGFYMIASYPNVGKSTFMTQLTHQMLDNNDDIFILDFSLDDPSNDRISRLIGSWVKMNSKEVKFPNEQDEFTIARRKAGLAKLVNNADKYLLYDSTDESIGSYIERIEAVIEAVKIELEKYRPNTKLIVLIDSFHDLTIESKPNATENERQIKCAEWCADIAIKFDLVLVTTGEVNKGEKNTARPYPELIKGAGKILFEAKGIIMLYNDVHANEDNAEIFYTVNNDPKKMPVLEAHICKNKVNSWKGRLFYYMDPDKGALKECDNNTASYFKNIIYK